MSPEVFEEFEEWECEEADKVTLRNLKVELKTMQESFAAKYSGLQKFMAQLDSVKKDVEERVGKKRKTDGGPGRGVPGQGPGQGARSGSRCQLNSYP
eukprot:1081665-Pyramimonas_sp.AAC.1